MVYGRRKPHEMRTAPRDGSVCSRELVWPSNDCQVSGAPRPNSTGVQYQGDVVRIAPALTPILRRRHQHADLPQECHWLLGVQQHSGTGSVHRPSGLVSVSTYICITDSDAIAAAAERTHGLQQPHAGREYFCTSATPGGTMHSAAGAYRAKQQTHCLGYATTNHAENTALFAGGHSNINIRKNAEEAAVAMCSHRVRFMSRLRRRRCSIASTTALHAATPSTSRASVSPLADAWRSAHGFRPASCRADTGWLCSMVAVDCCVSTQGALSTQVATFSY